MLGTTTVSTDQKMGMLGITVRMNLLPKPGCQENLKSHMVLFIL